MSKSVAAKSFFMVQVWKWYVWVWERFQKSLKTEGQFHFPCHTGFWVIPVFRSWSLCWTVKFSPGFVSYNNSKSLQWKKAEILLSPTIMGPLYGAVGWFICCNVVTIPSPEARCFWLQRSMLERRLSSSVAQASQDGWKAEWSKWEAQTVFLVYLLMFCFFRAKLSDTQAATPSYFMTSFTW